MRPIFTRERDLGMLEAIQDRLDEVDEQEFRHTMNYIPITQIHEVRMSVTCPHLVCAVAACNCFLPGENLHRCTVVC